jgi:hypothetical protein
MKLTRIFFTSEGDELCVDRPFDEDKTDQENCNNALAALVESMQKGTVVPALRLVRTNDAEQEAGEKPKSDHVFVNLGVLRFIVIKNVIVYAAPAEEKKE